MRRLIQTTKKIVDAEELIREYELGLWQQYFRRRGNKQFDPRTLDELDLWDMQVRVKTHFNQRKILEAEEKKYHQSYTPSQERLHSILEPLVFTRSMLQTEMDRLIVARQNQDYNVMVQSFVGQCRVYEQMGEFGEGVRLMEFAERFLINIVGLAYTDRCLDVYVRLTVLYFECGQWDKSLAKQRLVMQLLSKNKNQHNHHYKNQMGTTLMVHFHVVLLYC